MSEAASQAQAAPRVAPVSALDNALAPGPVGRLDPRAKLVVVFAYSLLMALASSHLVPVLGVLLGLGLVIWARLGWKMFLTRLVAVNAFTAFLWLFLPWKLSLGQGFWDLSLAYNPDGLTLALLITLKVNAIFLALLALLGSSPVNDIFHALAHLKAPAKLVTMFLLFYRYLHVMRHEYQRLRQAMQVRGFEPGTNLHTYKTFAQLMGILLVRSLDRSERVYQAMLCRGFGGTFWLLDHFAWRRADTGFCLISALALIVLALLQWSGISWS